MLARDNVQRRNHVELSSQQRRLRHVTSISARNITPRKCFSDLNSLDTYFTLHVKNDDTAFYTSEVKNSLNPTWQSFDTRHMLEDLNTASTFFTVRIWGGHQLNLKKDDCSLLIEWNVDLYGLSFLGDTIRKDGDSYEPNSIVFGLQDGYYVARRNVECTNDSDANLKTNLLKVDQELVRSSYNLSSLHRLHTLVRAIRQTQLQIRKIKASVQQTLNVTKHRLLQASECDRLRLSVNILREELAKNKKLLTAEKKNEQDLTEQVKAKGDELQKRQDGFDGVKKNFDKARKTHIAKRETLVKTNAQLLMRRKQLCHELTYIYPIEVIANEDNVVCGLSLPNTQSSEFNTTDEEMLSGAFGYVCHLVSMIGKFFQVPLRYPTRTKGSRSAVSDFVNDRLPDREREFPLYIKGKEKCQFEFGVFLLNKNIAQIRFCLGLNTSDLRLTLPNVKNLFDTKFGGSSPYRSLPVNVITRAASPPAAAKPAADQTNASEKPDAKKEVSENYNPEESLETEELCLGEIRPHEEYIVSHTNTASGELPLRSKPQTAKHKFFTSGQKRSQTLKKGESRADGASRVLMTDGANGENSAEETYKDGALVRQGQNEETNDINASNCDINSDKIGTTTGINQATNLCRPDVEEVNQGDSTIK